MGRFTIRLGVLAVVLAAGTGCPPEETPRPDGGAGRFDAGPDTPDGSADDVDLDGGVDAGALPDAGPHCGDGVCGDDEDVSNCSADCGCRSVQSASDVPPAGCRCDTGCLARGDCCGDACAAFGTCTGPVTHAHMNIYTRWQMLAGGLTRLELPLVIEDDPSGQAFFWAMTFWLGTEGGYIGLQTRGENDAKVARFSIWNSTAAKAPAQGGGGCRDFGGEGVGKTCWAPFAWREDEAYRLRVEQVSSGTWRGSVVTVSTGEVLELGDIDGPPGGSAIHPNVTAFTEYYGASLPSCEALNRAQALFESPEAAGGVIGAARSGSSVGPSTCAGLFSETLVPGGRSRHRVN